MSAADGLPAGYTVAELRRPSAATIAKRPASYWRRELEAIAGAPGSTYWQRDIRGDAGPLLSLAARGALELARHPSSPNLYRITAYGRCVLEGRER